MFTLYIRKLIGIITGELALISQFVVGKITIRYRIMAKLCYIHLGG